MYQVISPGNVLLPSYREKNINNKFSCLRLFGVVYNLVIHVKMYMLALNVGPMFNRHRCYSYRATCKKNFIL